MINDNWNGFYFNWLNQTGFTGLSGYFIFINFRKKLMKPYPINPVDPVKENENIIESIH